jgi:hypothetical protein
MVMWAKLRKKRRQQWRGASGDGFRDPQQISPCMDPSELKEIFGLPSKVIRIHTSTFLPNFQRFPCPWYHGAPHSLFGKQTGTSDGWL